MMNVNNVNFFNISMSFLFICIYIYILVYIYIVKAGVYKRVPLDGWVDMQSRPSINMCPAQAHLCLVRSQPTILGPGPMATLWTLYLELTPDLCRWYTDILIMLLMMHHFGWTNWQIPPKSQLRNSLGQHNSSDPRLEPLQQQLWSWHTAAWSNGDFFGGWICWCDE